MRRLEAILVDLPHATEPTGRKDGSRSPRHSGWRLREAGQSSSSQQNKKILQRSRDPQLPLLPGGLAYSVVSRGATRCEPVEMGGDVGIGGIEGEGALEIEAGEIGAAEVFVARRRDP